MNDTTIAAKLLNQLESFLGKISPRFHKPTARFIGDMVYGIMAQKDIKLSSIVRVLKEKTTPKKVEDRLSRMLSSKGLEEGLQDAIAELGAKKLGNLQLFQKKKSPYAAFASPPCFSRIILPTNQYALTIAELTVSRINTPCT